MQTPSNRSIGIPAIVPHIHTVQADGSPAPTFTEADVRLYYQNHPFSGGPTVSGTPPTVTGITFMTSQEARLLTSGETVDVPDSAMRCRVELRGPFYSRLISIPPRQTLSATFDKGIEIFDPETGNILSWGVG